MREEIFKLANDENFIKYVATEIAPNFITKDEWDKNKVAFILKVAQITVKERNK